MVVCAVVRVPLGVEKLGIAACNLLCVSVPLTATCCASVVFSALVVRLTFSFSSVVRLVVLSVTGVKATLSVQVPLAATCEVAVQSVVTPEASGKSAG